MARYSGLFTLALVVLLGVLMLSGGREDAPLIGANLVGPARVIDGDTIEVAGQTVRLHGIDAPEAAQDCRTEHGFPFACGDASTRFLEERLAGQEVTCVPFDTDRYDRAIARCYAQGQDIGQEMVAAGYAVAYRRYSEEYAPDEDAARARGVGLWSANMQTPATFRQITTLAPPPPDPACVIKGNISDGGRIYHVPGQEWYDQTRINLAAGERWFCTTTEAEAAGWRAAWR